MAMSGSGRRSADVNRRSGTERRRGVDGRNAVSRRSVVDVSCADRRIAVDRSVISYRRKKFMSIVDIVDRGSAVERTSVVDDGVQANRRRIAEFCRWKWCCG